MSDCKQHDWRFIDESNWLRSSTPAERDAEEKRQEAMAGRGVFPGSLIPRYVVSLGVKRRWYCTRCRLIDFTYEPHGNAP